MVVMVWRLRTRLVSRYRGKSLNRPVTEISENSECAAACMAELNTPVTSRVFSLYGVEAVVFKD